MPRYSLTLEYDGARFCGWQRQDGVRTVQGELEKALTIMLRESPMVFGASRTDKGVHALGQVAVFDSDQELPSHRLIRGLSGLLRPDIAVVSAVTVPDGFHPRFAASGKHYLYRVLNRSAPSPLFSRVSWHVPQKLNLDAMRAAAAELTGVHDFGGFRAADCQRLNTIRTVSSLELQSTDNDMIEMHVKGDGFLKYMVRIIAGTLVDIGSGHRPSDTATRVLKSGDRQQAGRTAPAHGLTLIRVFF